MNSNIFIAAIAVLVVIIAVLAVWLALAKQRDNTAFYGELYAQEQAKVAQREKEISDLQSAKKTALNHAQDFEKSQKEAQEKALYFAAKAEKYKTEYEALRDSVLTEISDFGSPTSRAFTACDSAIFNAEKTADELRIALLACDSAKAQMAAAQAATEAQFLRVQQNGDSKDKQINLQLKQLKSEKRKTIALGTVGGIVIAGGVAGIIALAAAK
jgi:hypothetical protein